MGQQGQGSAKLLPGKWSLAVAAAIDPMVEGRDGRRDAFAKDVGISRGRVIRLLDGKGPWYLEDVERACDALGLDVIEFLEGLFPDGGTVVALPTVRRPPQTPARKVAKRVPRKAAQPEAESGEA